MKNKLLFLTLLALLPVCNITYTMENDSSEEAHLPMPHLDAITDNNLNNNNTVNEDHEFNADEYTDAQNAFRQLEFEGFIATELLGAMNQGFDETFDEKKQEFTESKDQIALRHLEQIKRKTEADVNGNPIWRNENNDKKRKLWE